MLWCVLNPKKRILPSFFMWSAQAFISGVSSSLDHAPWMK